MKKILFYLTALFLLSNCDKNDTEFSHEIINEMNLYGKWHLIKNDGGVTETHFDYAEFIKPAEFKLYSNSKLVLDCGL